MSIHTLMERIRSFTNRPVVKYFLMKDRRDWHQICSSMDVVEDAQFAIESYQEDESREDWGPLYLEVYGLLQAFFIQQDAMTHLREALGLKSLGRETVRELAEIRDIRNKAIGHPSKRDKGQRSPSYHYISRPTLTRKGFELLSFYGDTSSMESDDIQLLDLAAAQERNVQMLLEILLEELRQWEKSRCEEHAHEKLVDTFSRAHYFFQKLGESLCHPDRYTWKLGLTHLDEITTSVSAFKERLGKRGIDWQAYGDIKHVCQNLCYPLSRIRAYLESVVQDQLPPLPQADACVFWESATRHFSILVEIATGIDEEYVSALSCPPSIEQDHDADLP